MSDVIRGQRTECQKIFTWTKGRAESGYSKFRIAGIDPYFDLYLLKYPKGSCIVPHKDPIYNRRHFRANLVLKKASGGTFKCEGKPLFKLGRFLLFRPDLHWHSVSEVTAGTRFVLSFGLSTH